VSSAKAGRGDFLAHFPTGDPVLTPYIVGTLAFFMGGVVQGCMGFGLALIVVPPLLMVLPATTVVPTIVLLSLLNTSAMTWHLRAQVSKDLTLPLAIGALLGLPPGIYLLTTLDGPGFKAGVGLFILAFSGVLLSGWTRPLRNPRLALYPVGFVGGFLNGSISISGPPVILFLTNQGMPKDTFRANLAAYFAVSGVLATAGFVIAGVLTREVLIYAASVVPAALIGTYTGVKLSTRVSQDAFGKLTLLCIIVMGLVLFIRNIT